MGELRVIVAAVLAVLLFMAPAARAELALADSGCGAATGRDGDADAALAQIDRNGCSGLGTMPGERQWMIVSFPDPIELSQSSLLRTKIAHFTRIGVRIDTADGRSVTRSWDSSIAQHNRLPTSLFTLPLDVTAPIHRIAVFVDDTQSADALSNAAIVPAEDAAARRTTGALLFALLCGLIAVPILYNLAFLAVLRERFLVWHIAMAGSILVYAATASGLMLELFPALSLRARMEVLHWSFGVSISAGAVFLTCYVERSSLSPRMLFLLRAAAAWAILVNVALSFAPLSTPADFDLLHDAGLGVVMLVTIAAITQALRRGSRAAIFVAAGWSIIILSLLDRLARAFGFYDAPLFFNDVLYFGLAFETVVTALGVAGRFLAIRRERDRACEHAETMERLAETDPLTGILNRRALQRHYEQGPPPIAVALVDLDHFKGINDAHGHDVGDRVLRIAAQALDGSGANIAGRMGGEEFVLLLYGSRPERTAEQLRQAITARVARHVPGLDRPVTASMGLVRPTPEADFEAVCAAADRLLYAAKADGRNRLVGAPPSALGVAA